MLKCLVCDIDEEGAVLIPLPKDHKEYQQSIKILDGTRKWYLCTKCGCTFCKDKIREVWQYSPNTYSNLLEQGKISNKLEDE